MTAEAGISALILAGGRASRLAGRDKGLVPLAGRPLAAWVVDRLRPQVAEIIISANRNAEAYAALGHAVVADDLPDHPGPLAGILAAGRAARGEWLLVVPCDVPFLPRDLAARLLARIRLDGRRAVYAGDGGRPHYAVMLLRRDLLDDLAGYLAAGGRQVRAWLAGLDAAEVTFPEAAEAFINLNTPEDLARAEDTARRMG